VILSDPQPFLPKVATRPQNTMGDANAKLVIVEYSDFNCGFCRRFYQETFPRLVNEYVATGKVRMSYKHYPFLRSIVGLEGASGGMCRRTRTLLGLSRQAL
jgi:hypothetical protein